MRLAGDGSAPSGSATAPDGLAAGLHSAMQTIVQHFRMSPASSQEWLQSALYLDPMHVLIHCFQGVHVGSVGRSV